MTQHAPTHQRGIFKNFENVTLNRNEVNKISSAGDDDDAQQGFASTDSIPEKQDLRQIMSGNHSKHCCVYKTMIRLNGVVEARNC